MKSICKILDNLLIIPDEILFPLYWQSKPAYWVVDSQDTHIWYETHMCANNRNIYSVQLVYYTEKCFVLAAENSHLQSYYLPSESVFSNGPNWVGVSHPLTWGWK
jgi:hypothetical protein